MDDAKGNCFDALRLVLAVLVVYGHSFAVGGFGAADPIAALTRNRVHLEQDAVVGFFGISGYLIAASWYRSSSFWSYLGRRAKRIFPGLWACLLVTAFVIAPLIHFISTRSLAGFAWSGPNSALSYVGHNAGLILRQWTIGDSLQGNPVPGSINSSLWTLWPEFTCYLLLAFLAYMGGAKVARLLGAALLGLALIHELVQTNSPTFGLPALVALGGMSRLYLAFAVGMGLQLWRFMVLDRKGTLFIAIVLVLVARNGGYGLFNPVLIPWLLISLGENFTLRLPSDLSYGTYLYAWPIQQLVCTISRPRSWPGYFLTTLVASLGAGWLSWTLIERHFVKRRVSAHLTANSGRVG